MKRPRPGDLLLTVDGGTSIGKPVIFELEGDWAIDSHVAILRPEGIEASLLAFFLASPVGQIQFQRAESGASGQTAVTEGDVRRFRFPELPLDVSSAATAALQQSRRQVRKLQRAAEEYEKAAWEAFIGIFPQGR